ncbi:MAG TPA: hypothetical protein VGC67_01920 [Cellulomonas sp.]
MNLGPFVPFVTGVISVVSLLAVVEMGVLLLRLGGRAAAGEGPDV